MDRKSLVTRWIARPLDWLTLLPFVAGATLGLGLWAFSVQPGLLLFAAAALILASAGVYFSRLTMFGSRYYQQILDEWRRAEQKSAEKKLDELEVALREDGDRRTDELLVDLRAVRDALEKEQSSASSLARMSTLDISSSVDGLFQACVRYLQKSLHLYRMSARVKDKALKAQLRAQREDLIREVQESLRQLGAILARIQAMSVKDDADQDIAALRTELDVRLKVIEKTEQRVNLYGGAISAEDEARYLKCAEEGDGGKTGRNGNA